MEQYLYELLLQCTVRVSIPEKTGHGTGFFVAPGLILTCAHVINAAQPPSTTSIEVYWHAQLHSARIASFLGELDLALVQVDLTDHPCVYLHEKVRLREPLCSYGYPDNYPDGDTVTCECEGWTKDKQSLLKFKMGQVRPGMSGAPLLNMNTGCVCGIVKRSSDRNSTLGGRAIPTMTIFQAFPELAVQQQQFHKQDMRWMRYLKAAIDPPKQLVDRPRNYIPFSRNPLFQSRPGEFEQLEHLLFGTGKEQQPPRIGVVGIGMVGMGGIGKSQLAIEFAYRYQHRFPGGIFWMSAIGTNVFDWQRPMAELAFNVGYLPPEDDVSSPENDLRRAQHLCRYLASHNDALLILDNTEDPNLVISALPRLAGGELMCAVLYTSRNKIVPNGVTTYQVEQLPEEGALYLLLEGTRPSLLSRVLSGSQDAEALAARRVCQGVGYLPLALVHLRGLLVRDQKVKLVRLAEVLKQRGVLDIAKTLYSDLTPLFATFWLSWEKVSDEEIRRLFKLASYFPEAVPIPLWLLGRAAGLGEGGDIIEPLGEARVQLQELSLLEKLSDDHVHLHPLVREFGRRLVQQDGEKGKILLREAVQRLVSEYTDLNRLECWAQDIGFWSCLERVQAVLAYAEMLGPAQTEPLRRIERWLNHESYLLGNKQWWPKLLPGLFYQQLFNRSVEEAILVPIGPAPTQWLRQTNRVGLDDRSLLRIFSDHADTVDNVAFSPDGKYVLTGSEDSTARIWETNSGKQRAVVEGSVGLPTVAFSLDGKLMIMGSGGITDVWEMASGKLLVTLGDYELPSVSSVAFSPDGTKVLTGTMRGVALVWETMSGKLLATLEGHTTVYGVAFLPDGTMVLTGSDQTIRLWETESGKLLKIFQGHTVDVTSVACSPDGNRVLAGFLDGTIQVWEISSGTLLLTMEEHMGAVLSAAFSSDGEWLLTGSSDFTARLWDASSGRQLTVLEGHAAPIRCVAFSPDRSRALTGSLDKTARLWNIVSAKQFASLEHHNAFVECVMLSPDGNKAVAGFLDGRVLLWDTLNGEPLVSLKGHTNTVDNVAFSPDGKYVLTGSKDRTARIWETNSGKRLATLRGHKGYVKSVAFSPDGTMVLTGSTDKTARIWDTKSGECLAALKDHIGFVASVAFSPNGKLIITGDNFKIRLWEIASGKQLASFSEVYPHNIVFSPDGSKVLFFSSYADRTLTSLDVRNGNKEVLSTSEICESSVKTLTFSPSRRFVIAGDENGKVFLWLISNSKIERLLGLYVTAYGIGDVHWRDSTHVMIADTGGASGYPHFYELELEGMDIPTEQ